MQEIALVMLAGVMSKLANGESYVLEFNFQDFQTGTVLKWFCFHGHIFRGVDVCTRLPFHIYK